MVCFHETVMPKCVFLLKLLSSITYPHCKQPNFSQMIDSNRVTVESIIEVYSKAYFLLPEESSSWGDWFKAPSTLHSLARFWKSVRASKLIGLVILIVTVQTALARSLLQKRERASGWVFDFTDSLAHWNRKRLHKGIYQF